MLCVYYTKYNKTPIQKNCNMENSSFFKVKLSQLNIQIYLHILGGLEPTILAILSLNIIPV